MFGRDVGRRIDNAQNLDVLVIEIRSAAKDDVFNHGVPDKSHDCDKSYRPSHLLVVAPVEEAYDEDKRYLLSEQGEV